ncbi:two-component system regulatory protein YycI [Lacticaseibacillus parakribbianus]|uniref:two-component system regulatory protein YycI n=1 Tax=Lacticaseibacillus parakribbianus TaxID=2970927 RepID=UPI0021CAE434|nr:two-component system regulatory protein YycI [Lacticaseibacillus parakribbianus]
MDFRRIEMIFLIVFIGLNIFLGMSFFQSQQVDLATASSGTSEIIADIRRDQIKLPKLATKTPTGGYLSSLNAESGTWSDSKLEGQYARFTKKNGETLVSTLDTPVDAKGDKAVDVLKKWVQNPRHVVAGDQYVYAPGLSTKDRFVFAQKVGGHVIYDALARLTLTVADGQLTGYTQTKLRHLTALRSNMALCSAQDAVITLYRGNEIANSATVRWTKLAYTYLLDAKGATVYVPAWFVGVESSGSKNVTVKKVNAINKTVLKAGSDD